MSARPRRLVLVTGAPRSGTTPIGSVIAAAPGAGYVYEPLNKSSGMREVEKYFQGPVGSDISPAMVDAQVAKVQSLRMRLHSGVFASDTGVRRALKFLVGSRTRWSLLRCRLDPRVRTVIWKDPFAALLLPHIVREQGIPAIVTVREPHAVAASFKRLGWHFEVVRIRDQIARVAPGAVAGMDEPDCRRWAEAPVTNAAAMWRLLYGYLLHEMRDDPRALWVDVGELISSPMTSYERIFGHLELSVTDSVRATVEREYADRGQARPTSGRAHETNRNVRHVNAYWKSLLTPEEQSEVAQIAGSTAVAVADLAASRS